MLNVLFCVEMSIYLLLELAWDRERERERENILFCVGRSVLLLARRKWKRSWEQCTAFLCCPGKVTRAEWRHSFSLDEIYKFEAPTAKTIPALNNNLKFFLSATLCFNQNIFLTFLRYTLHVVVFESRIYPWPYVGVHRRTSLKSTSSLNDTNIYIYIYIYIVIHRQTVSFYQNSLVWLDTQDARGRDRNPSNFTLD